MTRTSEYGSPFRNKDSGVDESKDKVNIQRLNTGFKNFVAQNKGIASSPLPLLFSPWPLYFFIHLKKFHAQSSSTKNFYLLKKFP